MRSRPIKLAALWLLLLIAKDSFPRTAAAAGVSAEFAACGAESTEISAVIDSVDFHAYKVPTAKSPLAHRDLEFLWSDRYASLFSRPLDAPRMPSADSDLDLLGLTLCSQQGTGAFGFPVPFIQLIYDYLRAPGFGRPASVDDYNSDPSATLGFAAAAPYGDLDRNHVDTYVFAPRFSGDPLWRDGAEYFGDGGNPYAQFRSAFRDPDEDVSSGHPALIDSILHDNSLNIQGPKPSQVGVGGAGDWTGPRALAPMVFNHEFQHLVNFFSPNSDVTEILSHAAEALTGKHPEKPAFDVPYTWGLLRGPGSFNYQAYRSFSAYLTYNFRGVDTTFAGRSDDLIWRWARSDDRTLSAGLAQQLLTATCDECSTATRTYFNGLSARDRLNLLIHNWRVANYVNKPALAEGQYGFPPQFDFAPNTDVGNWQDLDPQAPDTVNIELQVRLDGSHQTREISLAGRDSVQILNPDNAHAQALAHLGSDYWVVRSDPSLWSADRDLVVRIMPESRCAGQLMASAIAYSEQDSPPGVPDSLWQHPEWAQLAVAPESVDLSTGIDPDPPEVIVPSFGATHKAALIVVTLGTTAAYDFGFEGYYLPYRVNFALRTAPFQSPNPLQVTSYASPHSGTQPAWSPTGDELVFRRTDSGSGPDQICRVPASGGIPTILLAQSWDQLRPEWSPRGDWICFDQATAAGTNDVWAVHATTGESRQLTASADHEWAAGFAPNGQYVIYLREVSSSRIQLRRVNLDGGNDTLLLERQGVTARPPRWTAQGRRVHLLLSGLAGGQDSLYAVDALGPQRGLVTPIAELLPGGAGFDPPRGDGRWVFETTWNPPICATADTFAFQRLALRHAPGGESETIFSRPHADVVEPRWSPDGTRVAFASSQTFIAYPSVPSNVLVGQVSYNHAPTMLVPTADLIVHTARPYELYVSASDPDGETPTYESPSVFLPAGASFTDATRRFSWPSPGPVCSEHYVVFRALDGSGGVASHVVKFTAAIDSVTDLNADIVGDSEVWLTWTAPGDSGALGRGVEYELRYALLPLDEGNFGLGTRVTGMAAPAVPGSNESQAIFGLSAGATYYIAIRTRDAKDNWSVLSNVLQVTTTSGGAGGGYRAQEVRTPLTGARSAHTAISRPGSTEGPTEVLAVEMGLDRGAPAWTIRHLDADETLALGAGDTLSVLLQARDGTGAWTDRARISPRDASRRFAVRALRRPGRIVFVGSYGVRQAWNSVELDGRGGAARLVSAQHSRLGDVSGGFDAGGTASLEVNTTDSLNLTYELLSEDSETAQDWYLLVGPPGSEVSTPANAGTSKLIERTPLPTAFALRQNQPNPFSGRTTIHFDLPVETTVRLEIFDAQGRLVRTLADGSYPAGSHASEWDHRTDGGEALAAGVYLYRIQAGQFRDQKKMVLLGR